MLAYGMFFLNQALGMLGTTLSKKFQLGFKQNFTNYMWYNVINCTFGSVAFFIMSGFSIQINLVTFIFSLIFAVSIIISLVFGVVIMSRIPIMLMQVISAGGGIICSFIFGTFLFGEECTITTVCSVVIVLVALVFPFVGEIGKKFSVKSVILCIIYFFLGYTSTLCVKYYTLTPGVSDSNSFFFMTNVVASVVGIIALSIVMIIKKNNIKDLLTTFTVGQVSNIGVRTLISNMSSLINIYLIANLNLSFVSFFGASLSLIFNSLLSRFYFKEDVNIKNWISVGLAVCAVVISNI